jgi:signal transduction histidine kinase
VGVGIAREGEADAVVLSVRDSGPGIPESERTRVFDRFHRGAQGGAISGSGLGLAIVKRIAERHGAAIELGPGLAEAPAPGLEVTVRFARATEESA